MWRARMLVRRLMGLVRGGRLDSTLDEELRFHLDMEAERHRRNGLASDEARLAARRSFGGLEQVKETYRDQRGLPSIEALGRDLAHAARTLGRRPGYTAVAVLSLALGIGANTAVFSLLDAFVFRPLPYPDPDRLVLIYESGLTRGRFNWGSVGAPVLRDWRERSRTFAGMAAFLPGSVSLSGLDGATRVPATRLEPEVFSVLGIQPLHGRALWREDAKPGADRVAVIGHHLWQDRFGGRPGIVGQRVRLDAADCVIVGIMPPGFEFPPRASAALWVPLDLSRHQERGNKFFSVIGRVKAGIPMSAAREDLRAVSRQLEAIHRDGGAAWIRPLHGDTVGRTAMMLAVLATTVGLVLLLASANVAHMVLARANTRRHEFAVRLALGAGRVRIMRLLVAEGLLLALGGGLLGLAACRWVLDGLLSLPANPLAGGVRVEVNGTVLLFCALVSVLTALCVSVVPAARLSRQHLQADLAESGLSSRRRTRHGGFLVTIEVAMAIVLVVGAGMLVRSLRALTDLDFGFRPEHVLTMRLSAPPGKYPNTARLHPFYDRILERLAAVPGVQEVGLNNLLPVQMTYTNMSFTVEGMPRDRPGHEPFAEHRTVNPGFFRALGIPIVSGRAFAEADNRVGSGVIIVSRRAAELYWPGQDPVGRRIAYGTQPKPNRWMTIVGVAADIASGGPGQPPQAILYAPYRDFDFPIQSVSFIVRTSSAPSASASAVRAAVREIDPDVALYWVSTMEEVIASSTSSTRFLAVLLALFSGLAVVLAIIGVYGVMSYLVTLRHREIGVRMAMGASRREVAAFVLGLNARRALTGLGLGLLWGSLLGLALRPFLIGIAPVDIIAHAAASTVLIVAVLAASAVPAYRAVKVDPVEALRHE